MSNRGNSHERAHDHYSAQLPLVQHLVAYLSPRPQRFQDDPIHGIAQTTNTPTEHWCTPDEGQSMSVMKALATGAFAASGLLFGPLAAIMINAAGASPNGTTEQSIVQPDLVSAYGDDGTKGFVSKHDVAVQLAAGPEEAFKQLSSEPAAKVVWLYDATGNRIGTFTMEKTEGSELTSPGGS